MTRIAVRRTTDAAVVAAPVTDRKTVAADVVEGSTSRAVAVLRAVTDAATTAR
ncbi:hypothetical protein [Mycolicibacterium mengxianglii]|uniref:hypothetical protein n=1 Tax=Mycolicibacterium mengxianglii TaxID=2736649 RepID=UPI0018D07267|nr:hypothetical protein [Mycolicibacterium mengxianglii]